MLIQRCLSSGLSVCISALVVGFCALVAWQGIGWAYCAVVGITAHQTWLQSIDDGVTCFKHGNYSDSYACFRVAENKAKDCPIALRKEGFADVANKEEELANETIGIDLDPLTPVEPLVVTASPDKCAAVVPLYRQSVAIYDRFLPSNTPMILRIWPDSPDVARAEQIRFEYINALRRTGNLTESESQSKLLVDKLQKMGPHSWSGAYFLLPATTQFALIYEAEGKSKEAEAEYNQALQLCREADPNVSDKVISHAVSASLSEIANHYQRIGDHAKAADVQEILERKLASKNNEQS